MPRPISAPAIEASSIARGRAPRVAGMIYLLDTDTLIYMVRGLKASACRQVRERAADLVARCRRAQKEGHVAGVSAITVSELEFGARKK
jgi:predicted nucleic acid-binding protein